MLTAITREVSKSLVKCELSFKSRQPINLTKAVLQHRGYRAMLTELGLRVISLAVDHYLPDAVFVEDAAIVLDEVAVITRLGAASRQKETDSIANALTQFRRLEFLRAPATLDGGDVMRIGRTLYVGISRRTNREAINQLRDVVGPYGYEVREIKVSGCLHLKTACSYLGRNTVLVNTNWIHTAQLKDFEVINVPADEPWAANTLTINKTTLVSKSFPQTRRELGRRGFHTRAVDITELQKAEGGLTCLSLIFETPSEAMSAGAF